MKVLFTLIGVDLTVGTICGLVHHNLSSRIGLLGLIKHSVVIIIILAFRFIASEYNLNEYVIVLKTFYFIQYSFSILENMYCLGIPVPEFLVVRLKDYQEERGLKQWEK